MSGKLIAALDRIRSEINGIRAKVETLQKVRPIVTEGKPGRDGKDGESPAVETIVDAVLAALPPPEKIDNDAIAAAVLAQMPKPRDGRDAHPVNVSDVAAIVLAKIPKPRDGRDAPDLETIVANVRVQDGKQGEQGPRGPAGPRGPQGVSITDIQLNNNDLFVFLDGKKKKAGKIKMPAISAPFSPGGGAGSARSQRPIQSEIVLDALSPLAAQNPTGLGLANAVQVTFGPAQGTPSDTVSLDADGTININRDGVYVLFSEYQVGREGSAGTSQIYLRLLVDGVQLTKSRHLEVDNANIIIPLDFSRTLTLTAGTQITVELMRDLGGADAGGLLGHGLTDEGAGTWNDDVCATFQIVRLF